MDGCGDAALVRPCGRSCPRPGGGRLRPQAADGEAVTAAGVPDGRLRLADGRVVRLAGLDLGSSRSSVERARGDATLLAPVPADRHGASAAISSSRAARCPRRCCARAARGPPGRRAPRPAPARCSRPEARQGRRPWPLGRSGLCSGRCVGPVAVARQEGRFAIVVGQGPACRRDPGSVWIDFGDHWRSDVTVVVPKAENGPRSVAAGIEVGRLGGPAGACAWHRDAAQDGPRIDVTEPAAIERLPEEMGEQDGRVETGADRATARRRPRLPSRSRWPFALAGCAGFGETPLGRDAGAAPHRLRTFPRRRRASSLRRPRRRRRSTSSSSPPMAAPIATTRPSVISTTSCSAWRPSRTGPTFPTS